ncbi:MULTISPECIES: TonB-dependent siderophore receptor [Burkholderia]|uniref:TonB-dependent receptor n=1 Tax=Burkholderia paludis TaxID=1506587 RepID=A0A6J5F0I8_9BURK|nr:MULTISPECIES: TonB-dependent siderophore receptor [Burkholderia]CAB3771923.1 Ferrichrome outer membrane transporter/phage receptor [Burkholderia paludis]VWB93302.1 TonB-dependent receptor [Burkholderia paludis]
MKGRKDNTMAGPRGWRAAFLPTRAALLGMPLAVSALAHAQSGDDATRTQGAQRAGQGAAAVSAPAQDARPAVDGTLPAVNVLAQRESPTGPTAGIVATRATTATRTDTAIVRVPQSVSVVTRDQMEQQGATTVDQALRYTPGVYSQDSTDFRFDQLRGRGFDYTEYLDGLALQLNQYYANPRIDPYFLERIEVMRGPASVLYGAGSPAGIVNMVSKLATEDQVNEVQLRLGNHDYYGAAFDVGGKVDKDGTVLWRIVGLGRDADTQVGGVKDQRVAIAPSVTLKPGADTRLTLYAQYQRDPAGGQFDSLPVQGTATYNPNGRISPGTYVGNPDDDYFRRTQYAFGYRFEQKLGNAFTFRSNARYMHDDVDYHQSYFGTWKAGTNQSVLTMNAFLDREHLSQFAMDNQLEARFSTGDVKQTVLFGVDYQRLLSGTNSGSGAIGTLDPFNPDFSALGRITKTTKRVDTATDQLGVYLQDQIEYRRWLLTLGIRNDWTSTNIQTSGSTSSLQNQTPHAFTWRGGLSYLFDNGIAPYFSYAKSFQPTTGVNFAGQALVPTTGQEYEVGVKYQPTSYRALYSAALFDLTQHNVTTADLNHPGYSVQTGEVRSRGLELEGRVQLTDALAILGSYTYLNQVVLKSNTASQVGKRPTFAPRNMASIWADYTLHGGPLRGLGFGGGVRYLGMSAGDTANTFDVSSVVLLDAAVHYDIGNWKFALNATNLTNRTYVAYCSGGACYYGSKIGALGTAKYQW